MRIFIYLKDVIRLDVVRAHSVRPPVTLGVLVQTLALLLASSWLVILLLPSQYVELLDLLVVVVLVMVFVRGAHLGVVRGAEAVVGDELFVGTAVTRLAGELHVQPAVAGGVGLLELPDVVVRGQVVVAVVLVLLPGGLPGQGGGTVTLLSQAAAH